VIIENLENIDNNIPIRKLISKMYENLASPLFLVKGLKVISRRINPYDDSQNSICADFIQNGGIVLLKKISQKLKNNMLIQKRICKIIRLICVLKHDFIENILKENGILICLNVLRNGNFDLSLKIIALNALRVIFDRNFPNPELVSNAVTRDGGIHLILRFIKQNISTPDVVLTALRTLWQLCIISAKNLQRIQAENFLDVLFQIWKIHLKNSHVMNAVSGIASILLNIPELAKIFVDEQRGITLLVSTIKIHPESSGIIFCCICVFCVIFQSRTAIESDFQTELLFTHGVEFFFEILEKFKLELHLQENLGLLLNDILGNFSKLRKMVILEKKYRNIMKESAKNFPDSEILRNLVSNVKIYKSYLELVEEENTSQSRRDSESDKK